MRQINLIRSEMPDRASGIDPGFTAINIILAIILVAGLLLLPKMLLEQKNAELVKLEEQKLALQPALAEAAAARQELQLAQERLNSISAVQASNLVRPAVLVELERLLPAGVVLRDLNIIATSSAEEPSRITLSMTTGAEEPARVAAMVMEHIQQSLFFEQVHFAGVAPVETRAGEELYGFGIEAVLVRGD